MAALLGEGWEVECKQILELTTVDVHEGQMPRHPSEICCVCGTGRAISLLCKVRARYLGP